MSEAKSNEYDVIIIGSGMGGLTAGALLARLAGKRVLILERHFKAGGFTHSFRRTHEGQAYEWDVGLHYVGGMQEGAMTRRIMDQVTGGDVQWKLMPDLIEKFVYPDFTCPLRRGRSNFIDDLIELFPEEEKGIRKYFKDIERISDYHGLREAADGTPGPISLALRLISYNRKNLALSTVAEYLNGVIKNPRLKALLTSQWGDYGLPPSDAGFQIHALIAGHYLEGGYYPAGGAGTIAPAAIKQVEAKGGRCLLSHEVKEIIIEKGRAAGVRVSKIPRREGDQELIFRSPIIISNAGALNTYNRLIPEDYPIAFRKALNDFHRDHPTTSALTLYLGLKEDPRRLGFQGENHWIYAGYDHDVCREKQNILDPEQPPHLAYLSFPSLKDPLQDGTSAHTAEIITIAHYESFEAWREKPWKKRGEDYEAFKNRIARTLLQAVEKHYPGFTDLVAYQELSTPLSNEFFTAHPQGAVYGLPAVPDRFRRDKSPWCRVRSPLPGLLLTGADVSSLGIVGAMMGGFKTAMALLPGPAKMKLLKG